MRTILETVKKKATEFGEEVDRLYDLYRKECERTSALSQKVNALINALDDARAQRNKLQDEAAAERPVTPPVPSFTANDFAARVLQNTEVLALKEGQRRLQFQNRVANSALAARDETIMDLQHEVANVMNAKRKVDAEYSAYRERFRTLSVYAGYSSSSQAAYIRDQRKLRLRAMADVLRTTLGRMLARQYFGPKEAAEAFEPVLTSLDIEWRNA